MQSIEEFFWLKKPKTIAERIPDGVIKRGRKIISNMAGIIKTAKSFEHLQDTVKTLNDLKIEKDKLEGQLVELNKRIPGLLLAQDMAEITSAQVAEIKKCQGEIRQELGKIKKQHDILFLSKVKAKRVAMDRNSCCMLKGTYKNLKKLFSSEDVKNEKPK